MSEATSLSQTHVLPLAGPPERDRPWLTIGNKKLGRIPKFSLLPGDPDDVEGGTCPGATSWCSDECYAKRGRQAFPTVRARYESNYARLNAPGGMEAFPREATRELRDLVAAACRIHDAGDFWSRPYIRSCDELVRANPHVSFCAFTRSWRVERLREDLQRLQRRPNIQLFASVDPSTIEPPPEGWRVAYIEGMRGKGLPCPEQAKDRFGRQVRPNCAACLYCFRSVPSTSATKGNVVFTLH
jgi:hypothetical protein